MNDTMSLIYVGGTYEERTELSQEVEKPNIVIIYRVSSIVMLLKSDYDVIKVTISK